MYSSIDRSKRYVIHPHTRPNTAPPKASCRKKRRRIGDTWLAVAVHKFEDRKKCGDANTVTFPTKVGN